MELLGYAVEHGSVEAIGAILESFSFKHQYEREPKTLWWRLGQRNDVEITELILSELTPAGWPRSALDLLLDHHVPQLLQHQPRIAASKAVELGHVDLGLALGLPEEHVPRILLQKAWQEHSSAESEKVERFLGLADEHLGCFNDHELYSLFRILVLRKDYSRAEHLALVAGLKLDDRELDEFFRMRIIEGDLQSARWAFHLGLDRRKFIPTAFWVDTEFLNELVIQDLSKEQLNTFRNGNRRQLALLYLSVGVDPHCEALQLKTADSNDRAPKLWVLNECLMQALEDRHSRGGLARMMKLADLYLDAGADGNLSEGGRASLLDTPLMAAAARGQLKLMRRLRAAGALDTIRSPNSDLRSAAGTFWNHLESWSKRPELHQYPIKLPRGYSLRLPRFLWEGEASDDVGCSLVIHEPLCSRPDDGCRWPGQGSWSVSCGSTPEMFMDVSFDESPSAYLGLQVRRLLRLGSAGKQRYFTSSVVGGNSDRWESRVSGKQGHVTVRVLVQGYTLNKPEIDWLGQELYESIAVPVVEDMAVNRLVLILGSILLGLAALVAGLRQILSQATLRFRSDRDREARAKES